MDTRNNDAPEQNRETLQNSLRSLRKETRNCQLIDLLMDMNAAGALVLRDEVGGGVPEPCWVATKEAGHAFAERLFELEDNLHAHIVELLMDRTIAFSVRDEPQLHIWWQPDAVVEIGFRKSN